MKTLIVYDSWFGNTEKVARAVSKGLASRGAVKYLRVDEAHWEVLSGYDLVVVGTPVQGGRPSEKTLRWLKMSGQAFKDKQVAVFDTRFDNRTQNWGLKSLMKIIGYAAEKLAKALQSYGAELIMPPEGFIVEGKEGPLRSGELERAEAWGKKLARADF